MVNSEHLQQLIREYYLANYIEQDINNFGKDINEKVKASKKAINSELIDILNQMLNTAAATGEIHISVDGITPAQQQSLLGRFEHVVNRAIEEGLRPVIDRITNDTISSLRRQARQRQLAPIEAHAISNRGHVPGVPDFDQNFQRLYDSCLQVAQNYVTNISLSITTPPKRTRPG